MNKIRYATRSLLQGRLTFLGLGASLSFLLSKKYGRAKKHTSAYWMLIGGDALDFIGGGMEPWIDELENKIHAAKISHFSPYL
jgi:hypothetical protein